MDSVTATILPPQDRSMCQKVKIEALVRDIYSTEISLSSGADILYGGII